MGVRVTTKPILAGYVLEKLLGKGKYGTVYRASQAEQPNGPAYAIKILWEGSPEALEAAVAANRPQPASDEYIRRFNDEGGILKRLAQASQARFGANYVPEVFGQHQETGGTIWRYIVTEYVEMTSIVEWMRHGQAAGASPLVPEAAALEITRIFLELLATLHSHTPPLHLLDVQLKNYRVGELPATPDFDRLDLKILDWNGTKTFAEAQADHRLQFPASYDLRAAVAFLFEMLTGSVVFGTATAGRKRLMQRAGGHWPAISPYTRQLFVEVLGQRAGDFTSPSVADALGHISQGLALLRGQARALPLDDDAIAAAGRTTWAMAALQTAEWAAEADGDQARLARLAELRALGLLETSNRYDEAVGFLKEGRFGRAFSKFQPSLPQTSLDEASLRWHLSLDALRQSADADIDAVAQALIDANEAYPPLHANTHEAWASYGAELRRIGQSLPQDSPGAAYLDLLQHEADLRAAWLAPLHGHTLAALRDRLPDELTDFAPFVTAIQGVRGLATAWQAAAPESIYRLKVMYDLFDRPWDETLSQPPELPEELSRIEADFQWRARQMEAQAARRADILKAAQRGALDEVRAKLAAERAREGETQAYEATAADAINALLSAERANRQAVLAYARDQLSFVSTPKLRALESLEALKTTGDFQTSERFIKAIRADATKAGLPAPDASLLPALSQLDASLTTYLEARGGGESGQLARKRPNERRALLKQLTQADSDLRAARTAAAGLEVGWFGAVEKRLLPDLRALNPSRRLRYLAPYLVLGFVVLAIAIFFVTTTAQDAVSRNQTAVATSLAEAANIQATGTAVVQANDAMITTLNADQTRIFGEAIGTATQSAAEINAANTLAATEINGNATRIAGRYTQQAESFAGRSTAIASQLTATAAVVQTEQANELASLEAVRTTINAAAVANALAQGQAQATLNAVETQIALALQTPNSFQLTATAARSLDDLATAQANDLIAQTAAVVAENTLVAQELAADSTVCTIVSVNPDARVYRNFTNGTRAESDDGVLATPDPALTPASFPTPIAIGFARNVTSGSLRVVGRLVQAGDVWLKVAAFQIGADAYPDGGWVKQTDVVFTDPACNRFALPTLTPSPTPTISPTPSATLTASSTPSATPTPSATATPLLVDPNLGGAASNDGNSSDPPQG